MLNIDQMARDLIDRGERDEGVIARKIAQELISADEAEDTLVTLLRGRVQSLVRAVVRVKEQQFSQATKEAKSAERRGDRRSEYTNAATKAREALVRERFFAPGFGWVSWGEASVLMHQAAADHSMATAATHTADAERHLAVIRDLEAAGVESLDQLGETEDEIRARIAA